MRDGFAVRASDVTGRLRVIGEVRAGQSFSGAPQQGETVEIMTGAPVPEGADAIVMVEHCVRHDDGSISTARTVQPGDNVSPRGCEAGHGSVVLTRGARLDYASIACLASVGHTSVLVFARPRVAILSTGDEVIDVTETPSGSQIRNSNAWSWPLRWNELAAYLWFFPSPATLKNTREVWWNRDSLPICCC